MRLHSTVTLVCLLVASAVAAERQTEQVNGADAVAREVIVKFRPGRLAAAPQIDRDADAEHSEEVGDGMNLRLLRSRSKSVDALIRELSQRPDVELVEPNYILHYDAVPSDPSYPKQWALHNTGTQYGGVAGADMDVQAAWDISKGSENVGIGLLDTGVDLSHPDLQANLWSAPSQFSVRVGGRTVTCPKGSRGFDAFTFGCVPSDDQGHGTHIAGMLGATPNNGIGVSGINWKTKVVAVRTMNAKNTGTAVEAINGIDFLIQATKFFANTPTPLNVRVMSASWFIGGASFTLYEAIARARDANILFVASAGNSSRSNDLVGVWPANYPLSNIISVAATDTSDKKASFSNWGLLTVDLGAPGTYIMSTLRGGGYGTKSGTSMAAPNVSGVAALVLSKCQLSTADLKNTLLRSVDPVPGLAGLVMTGGRVNAYKALKSCAPASAGTFTLSDSPASRTVAPGQSTSYAIALSPQNSFSGSVNLSVSGAPAGVTTSFSANPVSVSGSESASSVLNVAVGSATPAGTYTLKVTASGGGVTQTTNVSLQVDVSDSFSLLTSLGSASVQAGQSTTVGLTLTPQGGFSGAVDLSAAVPAGVTASFSLSRVNLSSTANVSLAIRTPTTLAAGSYPITISAVSGSMKRTAIVSLSVAAPAPAPSPVPTTDSTATTAPAGVNITRMFAFQNRFSWTAPSKGVLAYEIQVCLGTGCNFSTKLSGILPASMTYMLHNPVLKGQVWSYRVRAIGKTGSSAWASVLNYRID